MTPDAPHEGMVREDAGGFTVWRWPAAPAEPAVTTITRAQGKAALIQAGLWDAVEAYVAAIPDPTQRALADVALHDTLIWRRDSPFLATAAAALSLDADALDALFEIASSVEL